VLLKINVSETKIGIWNSQDRKTRNNKCELEYRIGDCSVPGKGTA
jgi:hypothetical protein